MGLNRTGADGIRPPNRHTKLHSQRREVNGVCADLVHSLAGSGSGRSAARAPDRFDCGRAL